MMKESKTYQSKAETKAKLDACIRKLVAGGVKYLSSERDLCNITGGSRKIIREIISELEGEGTLVRQKNKREIVLPEITGKKISVAYVARGNYQVENYSWSQLLYHLENAAEGTDIEIQLVLIPSHEEKRREIIRSLSHSDFKYLIITDVKDALKRHRFDFGKHRCIYTDECWTATEETVISLDNQELGRMAARELHQAGCRRPAVISERLVPDYLSFLNREKGFAEECPKLGLPLGKKDWFFIKYTDIKTSFLSAIRSAEKIAESGEYDSIFLVTDEKLELINQILYEHGVLHDGLSMFTMDGCGAADSYPYPITVLSSASEKISGEILRSIKRMENGEKVGHIRCVPDVMRRLDDEKTPIH